MSWFRKKFLHCSWVHVEYDDSINSLSIFIRVKRQRTLTDWTFVINKSSLSLAEIEVETTDDKNRFCCPNFWKKSTAESSAEAITDKNVKYFVGYIFQAVAQSPPTYLEGQTPNGSFLLKTALRAKVVRFPKEASWDQFYFLSS